MTRAGLAARPRMASCTSPHFYIILHSLSLYIHIQTTLYYYFFVHEPSREPQDGFVHVAAGHGPAIGAVVIHEVGLRRGKIRRRTYAWGPEAGYTMLCYAMLCYILLYYIVL